MGREGVDFHEKEYCGKKGCKGRDGRRTEGLRAVSGRARVDQVQVEGRETRSKFLKGEEDG